MESQRGLFEFDKWCPLIGLVSLIISISGCVFPHPTTIEELPFREDDIVSIEPGITTRAEVESAIGYPAVIRDNSLMSVYGDARRVAGAMAVFPALGAQGSNFPIETEHLLLVRYDSNDIVQSVEVVRLPYLDSEGCTTGGICIKPIFVPNGWSWWFDYKESVLENAIVFNRPEEDSIVKVFEVHPEQCSLYLYHNERLLGNRNIKVYRSIPPKSAVTMDEDGYLYWLAEPGRIALTSTVIPRPFDTRNGRTPPIVEGDGVEFTFDCEAGKQYFINVDLSEGWFKHTLEIFLDDAETGKQSVLKRRLVVD